MIFQFISILIKVYPKYNSLFKWFSIKLDDVELRPSKSSLEKPCDSRVFLHIIFD